MAKAKHQQIELLTTAQIAMILARCGYTDPEQVKSDASKANDQALAQHVVDSMSKNKVLQPKDGRSHIGGMFGVAKAPRVPTFDDNDYENIQNQYEQY